MRGWFGRHIGKMRGSTLRTTSPIPAASRGSRAHSQRPTLRLLVLGTLFACLATCARMAATSPDHAPRIDGEWGGAKARVAVTPEGTTLEFPCATGRIEQSIHPDLDGRFDVEGTYTRLRGNAPSAESGVAAPASETVRYIGRANGDAMTISIRFRDAESEEFVLKRGASATVPQCSEIRIPTTETTI